MCPPSKQLLEGSLAHLAQRFFELDSENTRAGEMIQSIQDRLALIPDNAPYSHRKPGSAMDGPIFDEHYSVMCDIDGELYDLAQLLK